MVAELQRAYGVRALAAVFKRDNLRSCRLLERAGFEPAPLTMRVALQLEHDEQLMSRTLDIL